MKKTLIAQALLAVSLSATAADTSYLEKGYAALVWDDFSSPSGNSYGPVFAGDDVIITGYSIGHQQASAPQDYYLMAGGDISYLNGRQYVGSMIAGGNVFGVSESVLLGLEAGATVTGDAESLPLDFNSAESELKALSTELAQLEDTGEAVHQWGGFYLTGDNESMLQVFTVDGELLQRSHTFDVQGIPSEATVIINVTGNAEQFAPLNNKSYSTLTAHREKTIFNLPDATNLLLAGLQTEGVILAPKADIVAPHGTATMPVVGNSFVGSMELRNGEFTGQVGDDNAVCKGGLYGIDYYGNAENGFVFKLDLATGESHSVVNLNNTASNIASNDGRLYFVEQLDRATRESAIHSYDITTQQQKLEATTDGYKVIRLAYNADLDTLKATSRTYMYDYNITTGEKQVNGKMKAVDENFKHGDIAYSKDGNVMYVLTGTALYTADESLELSLIGKHGINWASGLAIAEDGTLYVSGRKPGEDAKIFSVDPQTAAATELFSVSHRVNDLTYVNNFCK